MADLLVVKSKIKDVVTGANVAGDFAEALDEEVRRLVERAVERAQANNRKTVMAKDL
jgi:histone H3/H4